MTQPPRLYSRSLPSHLDRCPLRLAGDPLLGGARRRLAALALLLGIGAGPALAAPNANFDVGVNTTTGFSATVRVGETTSLRITLTNNSTAGDFTGVAFNQALPTTATGGLVVVGNIATITTDAASVGSCSGTVTVANGLSGVNLSGLFIPKMVGPNPGRCYIDIPVMATSTNGSSTTHTYALLAGDVSMAGGDTNATGGQQGITVQAAGRPTWSKAFSDNGGVAVLGGSGTTLTLTVRNNDAFVALNGVGFTDVFPTAGAGGAIIEPSGSITSSGCGTPTITPTTGAAARVAVSNASIAANGTCTITVPVVARQTNGSYQLANQTNTLDTADFFSTQGLKPASNTTATVTVRSPLAISKSFTDAFVANGQNSTFHITLTNSASTPLAVTSFNDDPIDSGGVGGRRLTPSAVTNSCGGSPVVAGNGIQAGSFNIPANGSCDIAVTYSGTTGADNTPTTFTNAIAAGAVATSAGIVSQAQSATVTIVDDLRVVKSQSPARAAPGNPVKYSVTVQNFSTSDRSTVHVIDALQNNAVFLTGAHNGINYTPTLTPACGSLTVGGSAAGGTTGTLDFTIQTLPQRAGPVTPGSCTIEFWAMTDKNGSANTNNNIAVCGVYYGAQASPTCNGQAPATVTTTHQSVVAVEKTFNGSNYTTTANTKPEGTVVTMRIRVNNYSDQPLAGLSLSDTLPNPTPQQQLRIATPANASTTCGGTVVAAPNSTSLALNGGTLAARNGGSNMPASCEIQVDVVGPAGIYNNTASVSATQTYADGSTAAINGIASNTATLTYNAALAATKSFSPASITSGGKSRVTIRLTNNDTTAPISGISITDPLPNGGGNTMVLASPLNVYSTCAGDKSFTGAAGGTSVGMTGAALAAGASCDFIFDVVATGAANWVNIIAPGGLRADGGIENQTAVSATLVRVAAQVPTISKTITPSAVAPGESAVLEISINNSTQALSGVALNDFFTADGSLGALANGMKIAAAPDASTTCPGGVVSAVAGGTSVGLSGATLAAGAACKVQVKVTSTVVGTITNRIPLNALSSDQGQTNTSTQASAALQTTSSISLFKEFTPAVVKAGDRSRLKITFYNPTSQALVNFAVTDTLPAGLTVPAGPNIVQTCSATTVTTPGNNQVVISNGSLAGAVNGVPASCSVTLDVVAAADGDYVNTIPANALTVGGNPTSHPPTTATLRAVRPLVIHKAIDAKTLDVGNPAGFTTAEASRAPGAPATLTINIANPNSVALTGAALVDSLPSGLVVALTPNASTTCAGGTVLAPASATSLRVADATIPANASCLVRVDVLSNISGSYTNTIPAGTVSTLEGASNEEATSARIVVSTPPSVAKQFSPVVIPPNGKSTLTIFLGNDNASPITLSSALVDTLPTAPDALVVHALPNIVKTCPGSVTAVGGTGSVSYASGAQVPVGGCSISVDVTTGSTAGSYNNNIPAGGLQTSVGNNPVPANASLSVSTLGYISGRVFKDNNLTPNGTYEPATDTPLAGTVIELRSGASCAGPLVVQAGLTNPATTDGLGNYLFASLPAGTYSVCEPSQPTATVNGSTTAGGITPVNGSTGSAGTPSNPTTTTSQITGLVLNASGTGEVSGSTGNNFAEIVQSGIAGVVFLDQNNNGLQNGSDTPIAGAAIVLRSGADCSGSQVAATTTAADGSYGFANLQPGTYSVCQPTQPAGTSNGGTTAGSVGNGGTAGTASTVGVVPSFIRGIVLPPNTQSTANDFAEIPNGRTLSGTVFLDYNNNGLFDGLSDHGIGGQTLNLTGTDLNGNPVSRSMTTAADGSYSFAGLPEGTYTVTQPNQPAGSSNGQTLPGSTGGTATLPAVSPSVIATINLSGANTVSAANNFAEIPGAAPDLAINKGHSPASFGDASSTGYFTITPRNIGAVATSGVITVVDTLPAGMTVAAPAIGSGWSCVGAVGATTVSCTTPAVIGAGGSGEPIILRVAIASGLNGQILTNTAVISGGGEPAGFDGNNSASDPVPISSTAQLGGTVWMDSNHDRRLDAGEPLRAGWTVELLLSNGASETLVATVATDANGAYRFIGVAPGSGYRLRFRHPTSGVIWGSAVSNELGLTPVSGTRDTGANAVNNGVVTAGNPAGATIPGDGTLANLSLLAGDNIVQQSLPLDPAGVVYDAVTRQPVSGAVVTITGPAGFNPATHLVGGSATVTTGGDGAYQFLLVPGAPNGSYVLSVTTYPAGYLAQPSTLIPVCANTLAVGAAPNPALVQPLSTAPASGVAAHNPAACPATTAGFPVNSTQYFFSFNITVGTSANILNNHIPLDPILSGAIVMSKTTPLVNVHRADLVPYTITATNRMATALGNINVTDRIPPGFRYRVGSASLNGLPVEPLVSGRDLTWKNQSFAAGEKKTFRIILVVGTGVGEGEYTNQTWSLNSLVNSVVSNVAGATVRIVPDPTFDCSDLIGKVFDDRNANGYQDDGEPGIANVRVVTARGLLITTDADGRFHVTCADIPQIDHGSNFVMKLDERTLPSGYRLTTENPRDVRLTRGKMSKLNFGATVHRVVRLELTPAAFGDDDRLLAAWAERLPAVLAQLQGRPSILRIGYAGDAEKGKARLQGVAESFRELWKAPPDDDEAARRPLIIETELEGAQ